LNAEDALNTYDKCSQILLLSVTLIAHKYDNDTGAASFVQTSSHTSSKSIADKAVAVLSKTVPSIKLAAIAQKITLAAKQNPL
jgi:hypothetical protein